MPDNSEYDELAKQLGHVVMAFNELEVAMGGAIMRLLKQDDEFVGAVFVAVLGFRQKYELAKALSAKLLTHPLSKIKFDELLEGARAVNEKRNRFVHAEYSPVRDDEDSVMTVLHQRLKDYSKESKYGSVAEIFKFIRPINSDELAELADEASMIAFNILQTSEIFFK